MTCPTSEHKESTNWCDQCNEYVDHQKIAEDERHCTCTDGVLLDEPTFKLDGFTHYRLCDCPCHV